MPSAIKLNVGTALTWRDAAGDFLMTNTALAALAGRIGARGDLGAWPRAEMYRWYLTTQWTAAAAQFDTLEFYLAQWDTDTPADSWGGVASTDSALTITQRHNLKLGGSVLAESAAVGPFQSGGVIQITSRYISPVLYNNSATRALAAVATYATVLRLTPIFPEVQ